MSWLNQFSSGIEIYSKDEQNTQLNNKWVLKNSESLNSINQLYEKGYVETFWGDRKNTLVFVFIFIFFLFILYKINV